MSTSAELMSALAWSLLHFLWQGAAIAAIAAASMFVFRKPATRYVVGVAALVLMVLSFAVTFTLLGSSSAAVAAATAPAVLASPLESPAASVNLFTVPQAISPSLDLWVARGWLVGVFVFALRVAFGLLLIEHLRRRNLIALPATLVARFLALQQRLGIRRVIRYCECRLLGVPAVIGFFRPVVLIPMRALTGLTPGQLEAVIAHELGHIKRFDVAVNFFQVIAETLFFFHPAVWWLNKRIRADREDCCDDVAIAACGGTVGYARALATMETWRDVPSLAMAASGGSVTMRVARLLGVEHPSGTRTAGVFTASMVLVAALIAGAVSIGAAQPASARAAGSGFNQFVVQANVPAPAAIAAQPAAAAEPAVAAKPAPAAMPAPAAKPAPAAMPAPAATPAPTAKPARAPKPVTNDTNTETSEVPETSYIDELNSVGFENVEVNELIELKIQDVTAEYIREIRATGLNPEVRDLIALKVQGVTPAYIQEIRSAGFNPNVHEIVAMKVQGIDAPYVKEMRALGINPNANELIALKVQDVTPAYVKQIRSDGLNPGTHEIIAMKVQDITPQYRRALERAGYKMNASELIRAKVMGVTPEFIAQVHAHGFKNLSINQLIQLKNADVL